MPDAGGTFTRVHDWTSDEGAGIDIDATRFDAENDDFATALNNRIFADGTKNPSANLPMATFRHTGVGDAGARTDYAAAGQIQDNDLIFIAAGGTADVITLTLSPALTAYGAGVGVMFKASGPNTTAVTINVNGLGAKSLKQFGGAALAAADISTGDIIYAIYDGTNFQMISPGTTKLVKNSLFDANTILAADTDNTPAAVTVAEQRLVGRITAGNITALTAAQVLTLINVEAGADVTDATNVNAAGATMNTDFNAQTILQATSDNTPVPLTVGASTVVGRAAAGNIVALTAAQLRTIINVEDGADVTDAANVGAAGAGILADAETVAGLWNFTGDPTIDSIEIGFKIIPQNIQNGDYTLVIGDNGKHIYKASGGLGETFTIPANASVAFPIGTAITFINQGTNNMSIAITTDLLTNSANSLTGTRTLGDDGIATAVKVSATSWLISGTGLS